MKNRILLTLAILYASANILCASNITYELNGGVTNDYGWMSKSDMFTAFVTDAFGYDLGLTLDEYRRDDNNIFNFCMQFDESQCKAILDNEKWDWLEAYVMEVQNADANASSLTLGTYSVAWRYAMAAFFFESQYTRGIKTADFAETGKDEAYIPTWKHGYDNPTNPIQEFVLNAPYKEDATFDGWYGQYTHSWQLTSGEWVSYGPTHLSGFCGTIGLIGSIRGFTLKAGVSSINFKNIDIEAGIGWMF